MIYLGLLVFFVLEYVRPTSYMPGLLALKLNSIVPLVNFLWTAVTRSGAINAFVWQDRNIWFILTLLLLVFGSFLTADVTMYAWTGLTTLFGYAMVFWVILGQVTTKRRMRGVFIALIFVHVVIAYLNPVLFTDPNNRHYLTSGFFIGDGNDFALSLNIAVPFCVLLVTESRRIVMKAIWAAALLALIACIVLTQSRGGTLALGAMGLYYWAKSRKKVQMAIMSLGVVMLIFAFAPGNYFERMRMMNTDEGSASARIGAWKTAMRMAADSPLLGVGAGHFAVKYGAEYRTAEVVNSGMTAHSLYFLALGELGVPGFSLILFFVFWHLAQNRRLHAELRDAGPSRDPDAHMLSATSASLIAFAVGAAFLSCLYYPHIYVLCGILTATRQVIRATPATGAELAAAPKKQEISIHWALRRPAAAPLPTRGTLQ